MDSDDARDAKLRLFPRRPCRNLFGQAAVQMHVIDSRSTGGSTDEHGLATMIETMSAPSGGIARGNESPPILHKSKANEATHMTGGCDDLAEGGKNSLYCSSTTSSALYVGALA